jgi:hypothetical protein
MKNKFVRKEKVIVDSINGGIIYSWKVAHAPPQ